MSLRVLLSAPYMIPVFDRFRALFEEAGIEVVIAEVEERLSADELLQYAGEIDGSICGDDQFSERVLDAFAPRLKIISKWGTGIDSIDQATAKELEVRVANTPGAFTDPVADSVLGYMLAFARRNLWLDKAMKSGEWEKIPGQALQECTLGVIGVGRIGKAVLRRAAPFGVRLLGNDIVEIGEDFLQEIEVAMVSLEDLLAQSDYVSLNCDLNKTSHHLINDATIRFMKAEAVLINTARGPVVQEAALIRVLEDGGIAGAALDVFEEEPLPENSPLRKMDHVLLAPHNANSSPGAWERVHWNTIRNLFGGLGLQFPEDKAGR